MPFTEVGNELESDGTTPVEAVPSPASNHRHVLGSIAIHNADTIARNAVINKIKGASTFRLAAVEIDVDAVYTYARAVVCDATDESIEVVMGEVDTTNPPVIDVSYANVN